MFQATTSSCEWSEIRLGPSIVWYATGNCFFGPLLFFLYINDISTDIESEIRFFADDCVYYREILHTEDTLKLQRDIDRLAFGQENRV